MSNVFYKYISRYRLLTVFLVLFFILGSYLVSGLQLNAFLQYLFAILFVIPFILIILFSFALYTLQGVSRYIDILLKDEYFLKKIRLSSDRLILHIHNDKCFCLLHIHYLNVEFPVIIVPLKTPLSFFNASGMRIVGDGNGVIRMRLPRSIWDLHTEFDAGRNSLIVRLNTEKLKEKDDILSLVEEIKKKIEGMEYSDEHIKKIRNELVATNEFMKGHMCMKCGNLIPKSKLNEKCPIDGKPHETRILLLDIHAPYSQVNTISLVAVVGMIAFFALEAKTLLSYLSTNLFVILTVLEGLLFTGFIYYFYHNILNFKNMLKHFEAKKKYIFESMQKEYHNLKNQSGG